MMRFLLISMLSIIATNSFGQWNVKHIDIQNQNNTIKKIKFFNDSIGYAMGAAGLILRTIDAGETWNNVVTDIEGDILDFDYTSSGGIILTTYLENGTFKSTNGNQFEKVFISEWDYPNIEYSLSDKFYLSGAEVIYQSTDEGITWDTIFNLKDYDFSWGHIKDFSFVNANIGYAIADGREAVGNGINSLLLKTTNGGDNWEIISEFEWNSSYNSIQFINEQEGYILAEDQTRFTNDGGVNFEPLNDVYGAVDMAIIGDNKLMTVNRPGLYIPEAASTQFLINESYDSGLTWLNPSFQNGAHLETILFLNDSIGFVAGDYSIIMKTENCGGEIEETYPWGLFTANENELSSLKISISPNPATGVINISGLPNSEIDYKVIDVSGLFVIEGKMTNKNIDISTLNEGIYWLYLSIANSNEKIKFIKIND